MTIVMALDQGTSSSRAIVFNSQGQILGQGQQEFASTYPQDGWVEQDPEVIWQTTLDAGREAIAKAGLAATEIAAIGITNQRETTLLWDRATGACVYPAIVWQDRRGAAHCKTLRQAGLSDFIVEHTGLLIDPYFSATKLSWLLDNVPDAASRADKGELCAGTVDSFLIWRLTSGSSHVTDATNASRTLLFDIHRQQWQEQLLQEFRVPAQILPEVLDSAADFGIADPQWFGAPIPICGVAGDQQAALIGQACVQPGMSKCTFGTGCFAMTNTGDRAARSNNDLLTTVAYRLGGEVCYALEGSVFAAGVAVKWLRDSLGIIDNAGQTEAMAQAIQGDTHGVYVVPAFTGLGAPYWDADARGLISGITLATSVQEIVTATLASVAYQSDDLLRAMHNDGANIETLRVDGGMVVNDWFCQFLADICKLNVARPLVTETTALGAAILATLGVGELSSIQEGSALWHPEQQFEPRMGTTKRGQLRDGWQAAVLRARSVP